MYRKGPEFEDRQKGGEGEEEEEEEEEGIVFQCKSQEHLIDPLYTSFLSFF